MSSRKSKNLNMCNVQREDSYTLFSLGKDQKYDPILVTVFLNGQIIEMQLDTGASVSIISETTYMCTKAHGANHRSYHHPT